MADPTPPQAPQQLCSNCGSSNPPDATSCRWCHQPLPLLPSDQPTAPYTLQTQPLFQDTQPTQPVEPVPSYPYPSQTPPQYSPEAPTQPYQAYPPQEAQQPTQPYQALSPAHDTTQLKMGRRRPIWQWVALGTLALAVVLGGTFAALQALQKTPGSATTTAMATATATAQPVAVVLTLTSIPVPSPTAPSTTNTPVPVILPTQTPEPTIAATDTPLPAPPTITPAPIQPTQTPAPQPQGDYTATAIVTPSNPKTPNGSVKVTGTLLRGGQPVSGATLHLIVHYHNDNVELNAFQTGASGMAHATFKIGKIPSGVPIPVDLIFYVDGQIVARTQTSFTPRK